jgi:transposase-like protein
MSKKKTPHHLTQSEIVDKLPEACASESAAVAFLEEQRWSDTPCCAHCGSVDVYQMKDRKTAQRNRRFLWKCRDCTKMFTVRTNTVYAESLIPLHKWCRALWECASAKNGCSALEMSRKLQVTYRTALFLLHRIRHGMAERHEDKPKLDGIIESDEVYIGGRPRNKGSASKPINKRGRGTAKQPVVAVLQRGGDVRTRIVPVVNAENLRSMLYDNVDSSARLMTDKESGYRGADKYFTSHESVDHGRREYARGDVSTNSVESFFARVRRGLNGTYHAVSREHLFRYMDHFEFSHNTRHLNDGERTLELIKRTEGKRLKYKSPSAA